MCNEATKEFDNEALQKAIREARASDPHFTLVGLANRIGVTPQYLHRLMDGTQKNPTVRVVNRLHCIFPGKKFLPLVESSVSKSDKLYCMKGC